MEVPDSLTEKINLFSDTGLLYRDPEDLFRESSWVQVMIGQGIRPRGYHAMADRISLEQLARFLGDVQSIIAKASDSLPSHDTFIRSHCWADFL